MAISKIGNIILTVADLERSIAFYRDILGLKMASIVEGEFAFFDCGGVTLALRRSGSRLSQACNDEVSFDTDDVQATYKDLVAKGVRFPYPPRAVTGDGESELFATDFRDPDSHVLSITGWAPKQRT